MARDTKKLLDAIWDTTDQTTEAHHLLADAMEVETTAGDTPALDQALEGEGETTAEADQGITVTTAETETGTDTTTETEKEIATDPALDQTEGVSPRLDFQLQKTQTYSELHNQEHDLQSHPSSLLALKASLPLSLILVRFSVVSLLGCFKLLA